MLSYFRLKYAQIRSFGLFIQIFSVIFKPLTDFMKTQNLLKNIYLSLLNVDDCLAENWNFQKITSPFTRIYLVKSGEGIIYYNHRKIELRAGQMYLIPSFALCSYSSKSGLGHCYIHFIPQFSGPTDLFRMFKFKCEMKASDMDILLIKRLLEINPCRKLIHLNPEKYCKEDLYPKELTDASPQQIAANMESQGILLQLFSRFLVTDEPAKEEPAYEMDSKINQCILYILKNLSKQLTLSELAETCTLSNDYFSKLFLKTTGMRPIEYVNRKRIEEAQLQLVVTTDPIEKIALDVGIDNYSYFNRMFKKYTCTTPGEYRKLHRMV